MEEFDFNNLIITSICHGSFRKKDRYLSGLLSLLVRTEILDGKKVVVKGS